jgi:protocatechuate 4,5-dioxygenase beta chain
MQKIVDDPDALARYSILELVRLAGAQGVELVNWLVTRGTLAGGVRKVHANYHVPISNTATGLMVLENRA